MLQAELPAVKHCRPQIVLFVSEMLMMNSKYLTPPPWKIYEYVGLAAILSSNLPFLWNSSEAAALHIEQNKLVLVIVKLVLVIVNYCYILCSCYVFSCLETISSPDFPLYL